MSSYIVDVDVLQATSSVSIPFYLVTLSKNESVTADFVYNYYTRDEGASETTSLSGLDAESDAYDFIVENYERLVYPRQVNISGKGGGSYSVETVSAGTITNAYNSNSIIFEDAPFSTKISSIIVNDTSVDETFYNTSLSLGSTATSEIERNFLYVAGFQAAGYGFSKSQTEEEVVLQYENDIKALNLGVSINDLFVADVAKTATRWQASAYSDEFASVLESAQSVQDRTRTEVSADPYSVTEDEIDVSVTPISSEYVSGRQLYDYITYTTGIEEGSDAEFAAVVLSFLGITNQTTVVGYILEKYGEQIDGSTLTYPAIIKEGISTKTWNYSDAAVRYGGVYKYKLRTVYKTYVITARKNEYGSVEGFDVSAVLVASTGVVTTVQCTENVPPNPPNNISFQQTLNGLYIRWNFPINTTKDIKRFQVFRRSTISDPFSLLAEINFDQSIYPYTSGENVPESRLILSSGPIKHYIDTEFNSINSDYIYALCAIDAHGLSSAYSEQFRVRFDTITRKILVSRVSTESAPKPYPNINILEDFFSDLIKDSGHSRVRIYFDPEYADVTRDGYSISFINKSNAGSVAYKLCMTELNIGQSQNIDILINDNEISSTSIPPSIGRFYTAD